MGSARIDHQVGVESARLPVVTRENFDTGAVATSLARGAQRGHLSALENGNIGRRRQSSKTVDSISVRLA
jgi:hypothetical protein